MIIWITGLSGAGKTTLAKSIFKSLRKVYKNTLWFDGDTMREFLGKNNKYDKSSRIKQYQNMVKFVKFCHDQRINIIVSALYFNNYIFKNNKKIFKNYYQIYLKSNINELIRRDSKKVYSRNLKKKTPNIVGFDIKWNMPKGSNMIINNFYNLNSNKLKSKLIKIFKKKINKFN